MRRLGRRAGRAPGAGLLGKIDKASGAAQQGDPQKSTNALSSAEDEVASLDPSLASKLGVAKQQTAQGDTSAVAELRSAVADKTGLGGLESVYQKVTLAQSLLKGGESSKAKSLLDEIPSSPLELLKGH